MLVATYDGAEAAVENGKKKVMWGETVPIPASGITSMTS
jgi:hypothetical protein